MVYATFTEDMIRLLKELKGARFLSYECEDTNGDAYGNLRINTDKMSVELTNIQQIMPFYTDEEEIACFACAKVDPEKKFKPYCITDTCKVDVGDKILGISIVSDEITMNDGEYEISFDRAVIITMEKRILMFSRDIWFSEVIDISEHDNYDLRYPITEVIEAWSNEGRDKVEVKRTRKEL